MEYKFLKRIEFPLNCDLLKMRMISYSNKNFHDMFKLVRLLLLLLSITASDKSFAQNTFYYNKFKHWSQNLEVLAAEGNDVMAIVSLGSCYDRADGVNRDTDRAFELFNKAAKLGDFLALYNLGWYHFKGISTKTNYVEAEKFFLEVIRKNPQFMPAYQGLSQIYDKGGFGIDVNYSKAFEMYSKASELGDLISTFSMGSYYERGLVNGKPDFTKSLECYLKAKNYWETNIKPAGLIANKIAEYYLYGRGVEIDLDRAISYYKESIELGFFESYMNLATAYHKKGDFRKSYQSLLSGYENGIMYVCNNLGDAYYYGRGTEQSYEKAYEMFKKGSDSDPMCKYRQSEMLRRGEGVEQNYEAAYKLLEEAAISGFAKAQYRLGCDLYEGILIPRNYSKSVDYFIKALQGKYMIDEIKGDICRKLSICYRFGRGVEANEQQADEYNRLAASYGEPNAKQIQEWLNNF